MDIAFLGTERQAKPAVSVRDRSFLLGDGCFETLCVTDGQIEGANEHIALLRRSAETLSISGYPGDETLLAALDEAASAAGSSASLRITLSRGAGGRGADAGEAQPLTVISLFPMMQSRPYAPLSAIISSIRRNETSPVSQIKSTNYADNLAARREAQSAGADEALLLNTQGRPACFAMANLFLAQPDGNWVTPPPSEGVRPGYMRGRVMAKLAERDTPCVERPIEVDELTVPNGRIFVTNSLWGLRLVASLDSAAFTVSSTHPGAER